MSVVTSTHYVSAAATGENWRDISKKVLEQLESVRTDGFKADIGFLYITDALAQDAASILTLFKSVTGVEHWSGCAALGVCANGIEYVDVPAISVMIGQVGAQNVRSFNAHSSNLKKLGQQLEPWLNKNDPMLVILHADPFVETHPAHAIEEIDVLVGGFMVGGLASSRKESAIISSEVTSSGVSGFVFSQDVAVATSLSQGCVPMGPMHEISKADNRVIAYLDGRAPFEVFSEDMKKMAQERLGYKAEDMIVKAGNDMPANLMRMIEGDAHIAFPVPGSDVQDFLVRNIMAIDPDTGAMAVGEVIEDGQKIIFVHRDDDTVRSDLSATLVNLQKRIVHDTGSFSPKGALYISCVARAGVPFGENGKPGGEMKLIHEILGDIPITGFYANGEISNNRLYGYTGVLTLFL